MHILCTAGPRFKEIVVFELQHREGCNKKSGIKAEDVVLVEANKATHTLFNFGPECHDVDL